MKVCTMMEKELPKTMMGGLKIYSKVHVITRCLYSTQRSNKEFQIKIANEETQVELSKHLLTINISSLKKVSLLLNEINRSLN